MPLHICCVLTSMQIEWTMDTKTKPSYLYLYKTENYSRTLQERKQELPTTNIRECKTIKKANFPQHVTISLISIYCIQGVLSKTNTRNQYPKVYPRKMSLLGYKSTDITTSLTKNPETVNYIQLHCNLSLRLYLTKDHPGSLRVCVQDDHSGVFILENPRVFKHI